MHGIKRQLLSSSGLALLASLACPLGCYSAPASNAAGGTAGQDTSSGGMSSGGSGSPGGAANGGSTVGAGGTAVGAGGTAVGAGGTTVEIGGTTGSAGTTNSAGNVGAGGSTAGSGGSGGGGVKGNLRITLLGDSTTSDGCFRAHLYQNLTAAGHTNFTYVGTRNGDPGCTGTYTHANEGHGGYIVSQILDAVSTGKPGGADTTDPFTSSSADLALWFDGHPTDVVLMNFGTNDVSNAKPPGTIINAFTAILMKLRAVNPNVRMMVAQIPPIDWQFCVAATCNPRVNTLNAAIVTWAGQQNTAASPVQAVDLHTGYDATIGKDTVDGVHANDSGSVKIANNWYNAILPLF